MTSLPVRTHPARYLCEYLHCAAGKAANRVKGIQAAPVLGTPLVRPVRRQHAAVPSLHLRHDPVPGAAEGAARDAAGGATADRIRSRLPKMGALVRLSVRRVHIAVSAARPNQGLFRIARERLAPG